MFFESSRGKFQEKFQLSFGSCPRDRERKISIWYQLVLVATLQEEQKKFTMKFRNSKLQGARKFCLKPFSTISVICSALDSIIVCFARIFLCFLCNFRSNEFLALGGTAVEMEIRAARTSREAIKAVHSESINHQPEKIYSRRKKSVLFAAPNKLAPTSFLNSMRPSTLQSTFCASAFGFVAELFIGLFSTQTLATCSLLTRLAPPTLSALANSHTENLMYIVETRVNGLRKIFQMNCAHPAF